MKRRHRKPVLDINGESSDSSRRRWPSEHYGSSHNGSPVNSLSNLVGQYNSDDEAEHNSRPRSHKLNDQVNDFLKEIQSIAPGDKNDQNASPHPGSYWQECFDEQTGFPYYWHTETNQVTWEIPPELKLFQEQTHKEPASSHGPQIPAWSKIPPNSYTQQSIPEGMIPKEVVARNRNRQAGILTVKEKSPVKTSNTKSLGSKSESFEDEKIEMITSFGNEESESEESEHEEPEKKPSILKKSSTKSTKSSHVSNKNSNPHISKTQIGPALPSAQFGPQNQEKLSDRLSQNLQSTKSSYKSTSGNNEDEILSRLKNQAKLLKSKSNDESSNQSKTKFTKDLKLSLVPGYEDDSEGDDESCTRRQVKPLFPITESSSNPISNKVARTIATNSGNIRIYEYKNPEVDTESKPIEENVEEKSSEEVQEEPKTEQESKANKFLESIGEPAKGFKRKKRIAFDVAPTRSKQETNDEPALVSASSPSNAKDETTLTENEPAKIIEEPSKKPIIEFVKANEDDKCLSDSNHSNTSSTKEDKPKEISEIEKAELRALTEPIMEKLKFLSEGSPAASAVQIMAIQIQTLLCAWESGVLQETYLRNWLAGTGCELTRLEQTAAPPGWECQWDRTHKRYYYRNTSTNEAQWTYPQTDIAGGTEEMELCTTPPPPEHEETPIIEMSAQAVSVSSTTTATSKSTSTSATATIKSPTPPPPPPTADDTPIVPPPPPTISSPSPPPPPRINAEDLKRGQKRKEHPESTTLENKEDLPKESKRPEPMPPGVDPPPPEAAYALPVSALEAAGVLYGAQQTNPIYAATLAGAGIPLISHHPHLMQGQLMHYTPATYHHPHLHNQAIVAAARLQGQEAVQFMVAEYARMYENNQVIAKPPIKMPHDPTALGSALNSFYSDIATMEKTAADTEKEKMAEIRVPDLVAMPSPIVPQVQVPMMDNDTPDGTKERKKKKLKTGIGKKQKEMSSMVAKWQMAQKVYKEGHR